MTRYLLPLGIFILLASFLAIGLNLDPREVPSPFVGKQAPPLDLPRLYNADRITSNDLKGKVWILNVWASWCVSCRAEHPVLNEYAATSDVTLVGLNYKDTDVDAKRWLASLGNPYHLIAVDRNGDTGIEWGVYGVPETFVIDRNGVVIYKHIGPIDEGVLNDKIKPLISELETRS
ncbi:MAG: cytochrome C-type biogenesis protein [marine bacterium B5-7]|nr:MAG: cytochrome C-type biogenesis protein [marine bacterium B5-7]